MGITLYFICEGKIPNFSEDFAHYHPGTGPYSDFLKNLIKECLTVDQSKRPNVDKILQMLENKKALELPRE